MVDGLKDKWEDVNSIYQYQKLLYLSEIIKTEIVGQLHDDLLAEYFRINKTWELVARKYY